MRKIFCILLLIIIFGSCRKTIKNQIIDQIKQCNNTQSEQDNCIIDINDFVDFKWDKMYVFPSWSMPEDIALNIGFNYNGEYVKDDMRRILFVNNTGVIYEEDYDVIPGKEIFDFIDSCWPSICEFKTSRFRIKKMNSKGTYGVSSYYYLYPISP